MYYIYNEFARFFKIQRIVIVGCFIFYDNGGLNVWWKCH